MKRFLAALNFKLARILENHNRYQEEPLDVKLAFEETPDTLLLNFTAPQGEQVITLPIPYHDECGNYLIGRRVARAVGTWYHLGKEKEYSFWELLTFLFIDRIEDVFPAAGKRNQLERMVLSFSQGNAPLTCRSLQRMLDEIVNKLPLAGTPYEAWGMCQRVVFLDPEIGGEVNLDKLPWTPAAALRYQQELNKRFFPWTSLGLSDSAMVKNYLLKEDLRKFTPFGIKHHNPMRNLYQTLGMKGDETPTITTESAKELADRGLVRTGWNLMTCFLDLPVNFEDQLILDNRHLDKFTFESRRFICFGQVNVVAGEELTEGHVLSLEPNGKKLRFWVRADQAVVTNIETEVIPFNGAKREVSVVYVETKHLFKEGVKLTNRHGNKGVVSFMDCGAMQDAVRGEIPIDIIVSAKSIKKRKNYGQILEVLATLLCNEEMVVPDDCSASLEELQHSLTNKGYDANGTCPVRTQWGEFDAICGWSFWGLIKNPENQLWDKFEVSPQDKEQKRRAGTKVSHIELKALTTIFGAGNPVVAEILSHQQGIPEAHELVDILAVMRGREVKKPVLDWSAVKPLSQKGACFHEKAELSGTVVDDTIFPDGFAIKLPAIFHVFAESKREIGGVFERLLPKGTSFEDVSRFAEPDGRNVFFDTILVPSQSLRASWQHPTGMWGLSDLGGYINTVVSVCHQLAQGKTDRENLLRAVSRYYTYVGKRLSTKRGEISTYCLAVRYPNSAKATATLATGDLPENWLEIHESMAQDLGVKTGDCVIAERFPCLGFKSLRIQKVRVTEDPQCRFVIRVSGNSLVSQNLDFDGDVLFLMSFKTPAANQLLQQEFLLPDVARRAYILEANNRKQPRTLALGLKELEYDTFPELLPERQAEIVGDLTGVKRGTGTTVALAYNLMRIIEGKVGYNDKEMNLGLEVILDMVANSVFAQKHAGVSLEERCKEAICLANESEMLAMKFPAEASRRLCQIIREEAESVGVRDLQAHFRKHKEKNSSNIINTIVRKRHKIYFATRASLHPVRLQEHLEAEANDLVAHLWWRGQKSNQNATTAQH